MPKLRFSVALVAILVISGFAASSGGWMRSAFAANATLNPAHVGVQNSTFTPGECPTPPEGQEGWWGWHFIMPSENFLSLSVTFQSAGTFSADPFPGGVFVSHPHASHAYIWTPTNDTLLAGTATSSGTRTQFNLSHVCPGQEPPQEELTVSKTVETSYTRTHEWDIAKKVETENEHEHEGLPKIWLYIDGHGDETATWTIDVTYEGATDSDHNVSGTITIENTGDVDATITDIEDLLAGTEIDIDCGGGFSLPHVLVAGDTLTCDYGEDVAGEIDGDNVVTVTTEVDEYSDTQPIVWGDPATEVNATVNVSDVSDLFGVQDLGSVIAPNGDTFTYDNPFAYADYGQCGHNEYDNTATIVETGQSAQATLAVNVQCRITKGGDSAWAANGDTPGSLRYNTRGNWATYAQYSGMEKTTTLFAGQTKNAGTVNFSAPDNGSVTITVTLTGGWAFANVNQNLKIQGYASAPSGNPPPGQFANKVTCNVVLQTCSVVVPQANFYGVHVDVVSTVPDPNFGP